MRYLPLTDTDRQQMLGAIGAGSIDELFHDVPEKARLDELIDLPRHQGEQEVERQLSRLAAKNMAAGDVPFFIGAGAYRHHIPASVDHLIQRSEFLTSYTPYQPEISQGTLQYLFEFQTQIALLTGMDVANASMYDGSTACAEAVLMARRITKRGKALLSGGLHPQYRDVVETISSFTGDAVVAKAPAPEGQENLLDMIDDETACVVVQMPDFFGHVHDLRPVVEAAHEKGALLIAVVPEILSLGLLQPPGEMGADIVVGEGQSIGVGLNFGGPYLGLFATKQKYVRQMPGRLCGETSDADGRRGFVLTLSTREQHIRRERATSNICTNSGLCCLAFTIHLSLLGEEGFTRLAALNHDRACALADAVAEIPSVEVLNDAFFNEITVRLPVPADPIVEKLASQNVLAGVAVSRLLPGRPECDDLLIMAATETNSPSDIAELVSKLKGALQS